MHFLSHYYTELPNNNPLFVVALGIPDLTHGFTKIYNAKLKHAELSGLSHLEIIHEGIHHHFEGDKKFHSSPLFEEQVQQCLESFLKAGLTRGELRLSVIAHLVVEMLIDRQKLFNNHMFVTNTT
mgnify:CR=1 FL=1